MGDAAERINPYSGDERNKTQQVEAMLIPSLRPTTL